MKEILETLTPNEAYTKLTSIKPKDINTNSSAIDILREAFPEYVQQLESTVNASSAPTLNQGKPATPPLKRFDKGPDQDPSPTSPEV